MDVHLFRRVILGFISCVLAAGCANQNSIFRVNDTEPSKTETILIDAKQRPITVNTVSDPQNPQTCLARSADALSQAAVSGNLKITQTSGGSGEAGFGDVETATSLAFRTQVTEAQQEFLYYLCQLRANNVLTNPEVSSNLTHFQNTMLAMVAIDDLAGSVKPKAGGDTQKPPPAADPKADAVKKAQSSADADKKAVANAGAKVDTDAKAVAAVTAAANLKAPTDSLTASLKKYDTSQTNYATALSKLSDAIKADKGSDAAVPDDVTSASSDASDKAKDVKTVYAKATAAVTALAAVTADSNVAAAQTTLKQALADYTAAVKKSQDAESSVNKNLTAWQGTGADGKTKDSSPAKAAAPADSAGDSGASAAVANDVAIIVQTIVWQSFITEQCSKALFENYRTAADEVKRFCLVHLIRADDVRERQLLGSLVPSNSKPVSPLQPFLAPAVAAPGGPATPIQLFEFIDRGAIDQVRANQIRSDQFSRDSDALNATRNQLETTTNQLHLLQQQNADQLRSLMETQQSLMKQMMEQKAAQDAAAAKTQQKQQ
jgi:hypothetical protein